MKNPSPIYLDNSKKLKDNGIHVIPANGKQPLIRDWSRWCIETPSSELIAEWATTYPNANIGVPCGKANGIIGLDIDHPDPEVQKIIERHVPYTPVRKHGDKGLTYIYSYDGEKSTTLKAGGQHIGDLLSDGRHSILPPSIHPRTLMEYVYLEEGATLADFPLSSLPKLEMESLKKALSEIEIFLKGTEEFDKNKSISVGRNDGLKKRAIELIGQGLDDLKTASDLLLHDRRVHDIPLFSDALEPQMRGKSAEENALRFAKSIRKSMEKMESGASAGGLNQFEIAKRLLESEGTLPNGVLSLRYWRGNFYKFDGRIYQTLKGDELKNQVLRFIQKAFSNKKSLGRSLSLDVMAHLSALTELDRNRDAPFWIGTPRFSGLSIPVKNGIVVFDKKRPEDLPILLPHTPDLFINYILPVEYREGAICPKWEEFLGMAMPNDMAQLLEEWIGYNMVQDTSFEKFAIYYGSGGNGKSVVCAVQRAILGQDNVTSVSLESLNPARTFGMSSMIGALANIVGDLNEIERAAEGILKTLVSGEPISIERKFQDPVDTKIIARQTFATNTLPKFADKSDGLWRRLLLFLFKMPRLPEEKQVRGMNTEKWWKESGELEGIFLRLLMALRNLFSRNRFSEPELSVLEKSSYKDSLNPVALFSAEILELDSSGKTEISKRDVYLRFTDWSKVNGYTHISAAPAFSNALRGLYPELRESKHAKSVYSDFLKATIRDRVWIGLRLKAHTAHCFSVLP
jgi:P4 family phage/plasmid primase-like protien